jgi:methyltransferase (TIGR00027 family)
MLAGMDPVAKTGLLVAALRAEETKRPDRLFDDPFADALAGEVGRSLLGLYRDSATSGTVPIIEVRTRWYDEAIARAAASGIRQFVILASGMDSRAYRLEWPDGTRVFEIDREEVMAEKARGLGSAIPKCRRVAIGGNLADDWTRELSSRGFDRAARTMWLVEGLLQYLEAPAVELIFERIDALSAQKSMILFDVIGRSLLESPIMAPTLERMREIGAPWQFGTDDPAALLGGWKATVTEPAIIGNQWNRWPFPAAPPGMPGIPRGYLVEATKP